MANRTDLPSLVDDADDYDPPSITEVNGTIARFEMAYNSPVDDRVTFGPPRRQVLPSILYLASSIALLSVVVVAHSLSPNSRLFVFIVERDAGRPISSMALSLFVLVSAIATVLRASMRGVVIHKDGIETRDVLPMGIPKVNKWAWAQVDRVLLTDDAAGIELWNGRFERMPRVRDAARLNATLANVARLRNKEVAFLQNDPRRR